MSNKKLRFYCNRGSTGLMNLVRSLRNEEGVDALRINRTNSRYGWYRNHIIVNWGCTQLPPESRRCTVLNEPSAVATASNKIRAFEALSRDGVPTVPWTTSPEDARRWSAEDEVVYARTLVTASEGRGIIVVHPGDEMPEAPLYTRSQGYDREVRLHVFKSQVILVAEKKKLSTESREERGLEGEVNEYVRNTKGHWIFAVQGVEVTQECKDVAIRAINSMGLDFGSVDMLIKSEVVEENYAEYSYVLECNSASGIESGGSTLSAYRDSFLQFTSMG